MDEFTFREEVEARLGGNLVEVELLGEDYRMAFNVAKRIFIQRGNNNLEKKFYSLAVTAQEKSYTIPSVENIDTIIRIIRPRSGLSTDDPFSIAVIQEMFGAHTYGTDTSLLTYELSKQLLENINIYFSYDLQFIWKKKDNTLQLLKPPIADETWFLESFADMTDDEYRDLIWIQQFALAECKTILGRAYRKFSTLTTPAGETQLDGDALVNEGKEEKQALLDNIGDYIDGDPAGGFIFIG